MKIKEFISILLASFAWIMGWQLGKEQISFWIIILIAFAIGFIIFLLLDNGELIKKKEEKK